MRGHTTGWKSGSFIERDERRGEEGGWGEGGKRKAIPHPHIQSALASSHALERKMSKERIIRNEQGKEEGEGTGKKIYRYCVVRLRARGLSYFAFKRLQRVRQSAGHGGSLLKERTGPPIYIF